MDNPLPFPLYAVWRGKPDPLGATWDGLGVNFALFSAHAERVELCLFDPRGRERQRIVLPDGSRHYPLRARSMAVLMRPSRTPPAP